MKWQHWEQFKVRAIKLSLMSWGHECSHTGPELTILQLPLHSCPLLKSKYYLTSLGVAAAWCFTDVIWLIKQKLITQLLSVLYICANMASFILETRLRISDQPTTLGDVLPKDAHSIRLTSDLLQASSNELKRTTTVFPLSLTTERVRVKCLWFLRNNSCLHFLGGLISVPAPPERARREHGRDWSVKFCATWEVSLASVSSASVVPLRIPAQHERTVNQSASGALVSLPILLRVRSRRSVCMRARARVFVCERERENRRECRAIGAPLARPTHTSSDKIKRRSWAISFQSLPTFQRAHSS